MGGPGEVPFRLIMRQPGRGQLRMLSMAKLASGQAEEAAAGGRLRLRDLPLITG